MSDYLPFIVIGITVGSVYGIAALGLVLTYKTSGVFNLGHGAIAASSATTFFELHVRRGISWPIAAFVSVFIFGLLVGLLLERLAAALAEAAVAYRIAATVALIFIVPAAYALLYGPLPQSFPPFLPDGTAFEISGVSVGIDAVLTAVLGLASVLGLFLFFRSSRLGVLMRAVVDRPELLDLTGESPTRVRRVSWIIGSSFAAVSGLLLANTQQQLDVTLLALLVVQAFGAAAVGAFRSLPLAYAGGVLLGVVQAVAGKLTATSQDLAGLDLNMPFLFLFVGLLVIPRSRLVELGRNVRPPTRKSLHLAPRTRLLLLAVVAGVTVLIPFVVGSRIPTWTGALAALPLFLSLGLLVRTSGQISLCQIGFAAIGATTFAHMQADGLPWLVAVVVAGLVVVPVGALVAIPAIRLSGLYLALATLGFGILLAQFFYTKSYMFGVATSLPTSRPSGFTGERGYYFVVLAVGLASIALVLVIERSRLGRLLRGMADSPIALSMLGTNPNVTRVLVFCISAFLAGVSGALTAGLFGSINNAPFNYLQSLVVLTVLLICGTRTVPAAVIGTLLLNVPPAYLEGGDDVTSSFQLFFGLAVIAVAVTSSGNFSDAIARKAAQSRSRRQGPEKRRQRDSVPVPVPQSNLLHSNRIPEEVSR